MQALHEQAIDNARQIVRFQARNYIESLKPGDYFGGIHLAAATKFDEGSEGYKLFVDHAIEEMQKIVMDVDGRGFIVSITKNPDYVAQAKNAKLEDLREKTDVIKAVVINLHNEKVALLAACRAVDKDLERFGAVSESTFNKVRAAIKIVEGK